MLIIPVKYIGPGPDLDSQLLRQLQLCRLLRLLLDKIAEVTDWTPLFLGDTELRTVDERLALLAKIPVNPPWNEERLLRVFVREVPESVVSTGELHELARPTCPLDPPLNFTKVLPVIAKQRFRNRTTGHQRPPRSRCRWAIRSATLPRSPSTCARRVFASEMRIDVRVYIESRPDERCPCSASA